MGVAKIIIICVVMSSIQYCCGQEGWASSGKSNYSIKEPLAKFQEGNIVFLVDTLEFKRTLSAELFDEKDVVIHSMTIKKQFALGSGSEFYFLLLKDTSSEIRIARWVEKIEDKFYFSTENVEDNSFPYIYLVCYGESECDPEIFEDDNGRMWGCSKQLACPATEGNGPPKCKVEQTLFLSE